MRSDGDSDAVRELHHPLLLQVRQPDVALDQIVLERLRALQLHLELRHARNRDAHLVVNALPLHQIAGAEHPRSRAHAGFVRLALFDRFVRRVARTAHRGDAEREERAPFGLAEVGLQMRVKFGQARHYRERARVDDLTVRMIPIRVRDDARDPVAVDDHVHVRLRVRARHVDEAPGVHDDVRRWNGRRPLQVERNRPRLAGLDVDDAELVERLIENVTRVALPARRMRALRRDMTGRTEGLAARRDGPYRKRPFVDRGHLRAVRRPHRSAAAARVDRQRRHRRVPRVVVGRHDRADAAGDRVRVPDARSVGRDCEHLVRAFAETARIRRDLGEGDAPAVGRPCRRPRLRERVMDLRHRAGRDVDDGDVGDAPHAVDVENGDAFAVGGP